MDLEIRSRLHYRTEQPTDILLQIEAAPVQGQIIQRANIVPSDTEHFARVEAESGVGERIWMRVTGDFTCDYTGTISTNRQNPDISRLAMTPPHLLPGPVVRYLMASRYCPADIFRSFVATDFGAFTGGSRVLAISQWIKQNFAYQPGSSHAGTTAQDTFIQREGVCRDFAHLLISLVRASSIPARFASVYAPRVNPPDFHAVAEVFLEGAWYLIDPTEMAEPDEIIQIGVGMDAAEVAFLTSFGRIELVEQSVSVQRR